MRSSPSSSSTSGIDRRPVDTARPFADRDYRSGIFQLETLRLQKTRVQTSARESLREFVLDLALNLKAAFTARVDEQIVLGHVQGAVSRPSTWGARRVS